MGGLIYAVLRCHRGGSQDGDRVAGQVSIKIYLNIDDRATEDNGHRFSRLIGDPPSSYLRVPQFNQGQTQVDLDHDMIQCHAVLPGTPPATNNQAMGKADLSREICKPTLRMPRHPRELFDLLSLLEPEAGLDSLIYRIDMTGVTVTDIYRATLRRAPETIGAIHDPDNRDPHATMARTLRSPEFHANLLNHAMAAYPEKRRSIFLHVPKSAGTDLTLNLAPRMVSLPLSIGVDGTPEEALFHAARFARGARATDEILLYGHIEFAELIERAGVRAGDRIFTTIREPIDMMISQVSDILTQAARDPTARNPETRQWFARLGIDRMPANPSAAYMKDLTVRALLDEQINPPHRICTHLASRDTATYEEAISHIVTHDIEITTTEHYAAWLNERWGIRSGSRHNASERYVVPNEVRHFLLDRLRPRLREDLKLHAVIAWALRQTGGCAVTGHQIAALAGADLTGDLPARLLSGGRRAPADLLAVQEPRLVARYAIPFPAEYATARECDVLCVRFRAGEAENPPRGAGLSPPDPGSMWTTANTVDMTLPRPETKGSYLLKLKVSPFVVPEILPAQTVHLAVNGVTVGHARIHDSAVLECALPWADLAESESIRLTFTLPDAARPIDLLPDHPETRLLGLAFEWLRIVRLDPVAIRPAMRGQRLRTRRPREPVLAAAE